MVGGARPVALRTALIWHDEVMSDVVAEQPRTITVGHKGKPTFVVPDIGLPASFAIVRPGNRGYLLTLGEHMRGTICIDGQEQDVQHFVARGDGESAPGGFRATPISGRDWGVIDLDESGEYKLFFQFVPLEVPLDGNADLFSMTAIAAGAAVVFIMGLVAVLDATLFMTLADDWPKILGGGVVICGIAAFAISGPDSKARAIAIRAALFIASLLALAGLVWLILQIDWRALEWLVRGAALIVSAVIVLGGAWALAMSDPEQQASTGFSILMHGALLLGTIYLYNSADDPNVWPGPRALTGNYLVTRLEPQPEVKLQPTVGKVNKEEPAALSPNKLNIKTATKNDEGASGGKGEKERARDPNAKDVPPEPPKVAFFEDKNRKVLDNILDRNLSTNLGKFTGIKGDTLRAGAMGFGPGAGTGVGDGNGTGTTRGSKGKGSGGGGQVEGDFVTNKGPITTGKDRPGGTCVGPNCKGAGPREVKVAVGEMSGDPGGYTEDEINRVVKARAGVFRACYQKELNRTPGLGGKLVVKFKIGADGSVLAASPTGGSSLSNDAVQSCVSGNVMRLKFPPKGGIANVVYPFVFSQGG